MAPERTLFEAHRDARQAMDVASTAVPRAPTRAAARLPGVIDPTIIHHASLRDSAPCAATGSVFEVVETTKSSSADTDPRDSAPCAASGSALKIDELS
mmetsp:Transcript_1823/g.5720  ORF Transcript_1823/g.5720 Transcript_1823/m.5720 type:complete len:98 (+) Transcript_1823:596-889(+)